MLTDFCLMAQPALLETKPLASINLWMNSAQSRSSTHYDPHHNLLCVISGCKQGNTSLYSRFPFYCIQKFTRSSYTYHLDMYVLLYCLIQVPISHTFALNIFVLVFVCDNNSLSTINQGAFTDILFECSYVQDIFLVGQKEVDLSLF